MKEKILQKMEESFLKAEKYFGKSFRRPETILWKTRGTSAGYADYSVGKKLIMFQLAIAERDWDEFINETVPHEVAHYVQLQQFPYSKAHGKEWQRIMTEVMGIPATTCHQVSTEGLYTPRNTTKYEYSCGCKGKVHKVSSVIHNRMTKKGRSYRCQNCYAPIKFLGGVTTKFEMKVERKIDKVQSEIEKLKQQIANLQK